MADSPLPRLAFSPAEAATVLGMSRARMYELIMDGTIPSVKIGRLRRIRAGELDAYLDRLSVAS